MLVGLGLESVADGRDHNDLYELRQLGCERIISAQDKFELKIRLDELLEYLRAGDVLAVVSLTRLATEVDQLLAILTKFKETNILLLAKEQGILPGTALGDGFIDACYWLSEATRTAPEVQDRSQVRGRGRPTALNPEDKARVARLLLERRATVLEVARALRVSPATIYRHFPRRNHDPDPST